jgi:predicted Zn-dependent peptidase
MIFVLAGSVTPEQHRSLAAEHFAGLPPAQPPVPAPAGYGPLQNLSLHRQLKQANLCFALPGPSYADPERTMATVRLLHVILGGAMSSRLFLRVRERMGLCYLIRSLIEPGADVGSILVLTATEPSQAPRLTEAILAEIHRLRREGVQRQELETARAILKGLWVLEREDSGNWARLSAFELLQLGRVRSREEHFATLDSITAEEVWAAADRYLGADGMRCALVGPAEVERSLDRSGLLPAGRWNTIEDLGSA